jgi:hypothetical protein
VNGALRAGLYRQPHSYTCEADCGHNPLGLLEMVEALHTNLTGSSDCETKEQLTQYRDILQIAIDTWQTASQPCWWNAYDDAVKALIEAVLVEAKRPNLQYLFKS